MTRLGWSREANFGHFCPLATSGQGKPKNFHRQGPCYSQRVCLSKKLKCMPVGSCSALTRIHKQLAGEWVPLMVAP